MQPERATETTKVYKTQTGLEYRKVSREVRKKKVAQEEWTEEQCKGMMLRHSRDAYNTLKALTKTQQHKPAAIQDSSENILIESTSVLNQWTEYCSGLYNYELHPDTSLLQSNHADPYTRS